VQADAQTHGFPPRRFDVAISRLGTMFFADPATAGTILTTAGFTDVDVTGMHEPVCYGPRRRQRPPRHPSLQMTKDLIAPLDTARTGHAHQGDSGVFFDSHRSTP
jgi:hypothetical protein